MKFRLTLLSIALLGFTLTPGFAQDQNKPDQSKPNDTSVSTVPAQTGNTPQASPDDKDDKDKDKDQADQANKPPDPTVQPADPSKVKHDGGKSDIDAIGNRKVGGRG